MSVVLARSAVFGDARGGQDECIRLGNRQVGVGRAGITTVDRCRIRRRGSGEKGSAGPQGRGGHTGGSLGMQMRCGWDVVGMRAGCGCRARNWGLSKYGTCDASAPAPQCLCAWCLWWQGRSSLSVSVCAALLGETRQGIDGWMLTAIALRLVRLFRPGKHGHTTQQESHCCHRQSSPHTLRSREQRMQ